VIHRDIKPQNILLTEDGIPKLVDFGLARMGRESDLSLSGYGLGTLAYMAPEQQRDASRSDHRSDIFSLGKTLYHMVTGEVPYAVDAEATPEHMRAAITRALKPRPEDRYFSVDEFLDAVERAPQTGSLRPAPVASAVATVCSNCGLANSEDVRYCMGCGASLLVACSRCGRENRAGTRFCGGCGSSITRRGENPGRLETARDHVADNRQSSAVMETGVREFAGSDAVYQRWLAANPGGFVINMYRDMDPNHYSMLHRATCHTITACSGQARPGGLTERDFVKVCAGSIEDLRDWVRRHGRPNGTFKSECSKCRPK
jgi:serine/threonine protein kinase